MIGLICWVFGDKQSFSVDISEKTVNGLKEAIAKISDRFQGTIAYILEHWQKIISSIGKKKLQSSGLNDDETLDEAHKTGKYFIGDPLGEHIHIVIGVSEFLTRISAQSRRLKEVDRPFLQDILARGDADGKMILKCEKIGVPDHDGDSASFVLVMETEYKYIDLGSGFEKFFAEAKSLLEPSRPKLRSRILGCVLTPIFNKSVLVRVECWKILKPVTQLQQDEQRRGGIDKPSRKLG